MPPGLARDDCQRREIFGAALQQAEELATAARDVGYATKPILLFYALCQGYRAVCAARLTDEWERVGHGLGFRSDGNSVITDSVVIPKPGNCDLFTGAITVAEEEALPGPVSVGELLASIFEIRDIEIPGPHRPRPLILRLPHGDQVLSNPDAKAPADAIFAMVDGLPQVESKAELMEAIAVYPTLIGGEPAPYPSGVQSGVLNDEDVRNGVTYRRGVFPTESFPLVRFSFDGSAVQDYLSRFESVAPFQLVDTPNVRIAPTGVGPDNRVLGPIACWWSLMIGLSSLARYHPSQWRQALDIDREPIAPGLERILDQAEASIPHFVHQGLTHESRA